MDKLYFVYVYVDRSREKAGDKTRRGGVKQWRWKNSKLMKMF